MKWVGLFLRGNIISYINVCFRKKHFSTARHHGLVEIFETYFYSLNQQIRVPQTDADYSNRVVNLDEKLSLFKEFGNATSIS